MKIALENLTKSFGPVRVLDSITYEVEFPHAIVLIGPSGGGKSTLLRTIAGLEIPNAGSIAVDGESLRFTEDWLRTYRRRIGVVFQAYNLFPHLTALENVALPLEKVHGQRREPARAKALEVLSRFQLADHCGRKPAELSGGQRQRVAIARALAVEPKFLLLDEPTSALDPEMTGEVLDVIAELRDSKTPLILVTHEMGFARHCADVVAFLAGGKIAESNTAEAFFSAPKSEAAVRFLERVMKY